MHATKPHSRDMPCSSTKPPPVRQACRPDSRYPRYPAPRSRLRSNSFPNRDTPWQLKFGQSPSQVDWLRPGAGNCMCIYEGVTGSAVKHVPFTVHPHVEPAWPGGPVGEQSSHGCTKPCRQYWRYCGRQAPLCGVCCCPCMVPHVLPTDRLTARAEGVPRQVEGPRRRGPSTCST